MNRNVVLGIVAALIAVLIVLGIYRQVDKKQEKGVIKIGAILPLTGAASVAGEASRKGLELAVENYNNSNPQEQAELILQDSKSNAKDGLNAYQQLISTNKVNLIYSQLSNVCLALKQFTEMNKQIHLAVSGSNILLEDSKLIYRNYSDPKDVALTAVKFCNDSLSIKNLVIYYPNNDFGKSINKEIEYVLNQDERENFKSFTYDEKVLDFNNFILKSFQNTKPDAIYIVGLGQPLGQIIKNLRVLKYSGKIIGGLETPFTDVMKVAGDAIHGVYYVSFNYDPDKDSSDFTKKFYTKFKITPQAPAIVAFTAVSTFLKYKMNVDSLSMNLIESPLGNFSIQNRNLKYPLVVKMID